VTPAQVRARGAVNDAPVQEAACRVLVDDGWGSFTIARVAAVLGRSVRTVSARAGTPAELASQLVATTAGPQLVDRCADVVGAWQVGRHLGQAWPLCAALRRTAQWQSSDEARLLAELVVVARFVPEVDAAFVESIRAPIAAMSRLPGGDGVVPMLAALTVGLALSSRAERAGLLLEDGAFASYAQAVLGADEPRVLPEEPADHMDLEPRLHPDPIMNALLNRMLRLVAERGYDGTRIKDVAADVGVSEGYVFSRFPTKASLLAAALAYHDEAGYALNEAYVRRLEVTYGRGVANAITMREALRPSRVVPATQVLELARLSWHDPDGARAAAQAADELRADLLREPGWAAYETEAEFHLEVAQFVGVLTMPLVVDDALAVPLDAVMAPWDRVRRERVAAGR
jgi:AcrR family transcriptional regulator